MAQFSVIYEGLVRQEYVVEAETAEEAREKWSDTEPVSSEVIEGNVTEVIEDTDED